MTNSNCNHPACHPVHAFRPLYSCFEVQGKSESQKICTNLYILSSFYGVKPVPKKMSGKGRDRSLAAMSCPVPILHTSDNSTQDNSS